MKRALLCLLAAALLIGAGGFRVVRAEDAQPVGRVYLTVSSIDLTLVGDTENIYVGTAPVEEIAWSSEDPGIVSVENGVLTANGVGKTVIHADYFDQHWQCAAGCIAESEAVLQEMPIDELAAPKRLPPVTDYDPVPYFSDAALVGDSITFIFFQNEMFSNQLGHPQFVARGGCSIVGFLYGGWPMHYQGQEMTLEDAVQACGAKKIFVLLGQNDLHQISVEEALEHYATILGWVRDKNPDVEIILQTVTPEYTEYDNYSTINDTIREFNAHLPEFAEEQGCKLMDLAIYIESHRGRMSPYYNLTPSDSIHLNPAGCTIWGQVLSAYAELEEIRRETE